MEGTDRTFIEPFVTLTYLAGVTEKIGLGAATIIPFRHPINMAYSVASMSWMTRRRFDLGIGAGNFQHEFDVIGQGDLKRPELMKEQTLIARELWTGETRRVAQRASTTSTDVDLKPQPLHPVPVWWGGATPGLGPPGGRLLRGLAARAHHLPDLRGAGRQDPRDDRRAGQADDHDRRRAGHQHRHLVRGRDRPA